MNLSRHVVEALDPGVDAVVRWHPTLQVDLPRRRGAVLFQQRSRTARSRGRIVGVLDADGLTLPSWVPHRLDQVLLPHARALVADRDVFLDLLAEARANTANAFAPGAPLRDMPAMVQQLDCLGVVYQMDDRTRRQVAFAMVRGGYEGPAAELPELAAAACTGAATTADAPAAGQLPVS